MKLVINTVMETAKTANHVRKSMRLTLDDDHPQLKQQQQKERRRQLLLPPSQPPPQLSSCSLEDLTQKSKSSTSCGSGVDDMLGKRQKKGPQRRITRQRQRSVIGCACIQAVLSKGGLKGKVGG